MMIYLKRFSSDLHLRCRISFSVCLAERAALVSFSLDCLSAPHRRSVCRSAKTKPEQIACAPNQKSEYEKEKRRASGAKKLPSCICKQSKHKGRGEKSPVFPDFFIGTKIDVVLELSPVTLWISVIDFMCAARRVAASPFLLRYVDFSFRCVAHAAARALSHAHRRTAKARRDAPSTITCKRAQWIIYLTQHTIRASDGSERKKIGHLKNYYFHQAQL